MTRKQEIPAPNEEMIRALIERPQSIPLALRTKVRKEVMEYVQRDDRWRELYIRVNSELGKKLAKEKPDPDDDSCVGNQ